MINNSYYSQDVHGPCELHDIGDLELEEGDTIRACMLAYATFGTLSAAKDNAIFVTTWYSGTNKIMEQVYIGPGPALDPDRYFVIVVNQIDNGLSTSPHNTPAPGGIGYFPHVRIGDDVRAQHKFIMEKFGIERLALVAGGSMGGFFGVMDPNDLLCMAWKWQRGDVSRHTGGDLRAALGRNKVETFVLPMSSDMFFPPADFRAEWQPILDAEFRPIQTLDGHLALFGADPHAIAQLDGHLNELLALSPTAD